MKFFALIKVTVKNFFRHAFRSCLAALGVVLGVAAVVAMTAISEGARRDSLDDIIAHGIDNIIIGLSHFAGLIPFFSASRVFMLIITFNTR